MLTFNTLRSTSAGNCSVLTSPEASILIDCGTGSTAALKGYLKKPLDGILITHIHADHLSPATIKIAKQHHCPVYLHSKMLLDLDKNTQARQMRDLLPQIRVHLHKGETLKIKDLSIESFDLTHGPGPQGPAIKCLGYVINQHFAYMTDTGRVPKAAFAALAQVHTLMIECNHDEDMAKKQAQNQPAMAYKVARQLSAFGHLSNEQCAEAILEILKKQGKNRKLQRVLLGHLSDTCNTHEIALQTVTDLLADAGYEDVEIEVAVEAEPLQLGLIPSAV